MSEPAASSSQQPGPRTGHGQVLPAEIGAHALGKVVDELDRYLGVRTDSVTLLVFLGGVTGKMASPINLPIISGEPGADLLSTNRLLDLFGGAAKRTNSLRHLPILERKKFRNIAVILLRGSRRTLFRDATELLTRVIGDDEGLPSLLKISENTPDVAGVGATLRFITAQAPRDFRGFGDSFATRRDPKQHEKLLNLIGHLPRQPWYGCDFHNEMRAALRPEEKLISERLLGTLAAIRMSCTNDHTAAFITREDYRRHRQLLVKLPVAPTDSKLSPGAIETAEIIYEKVHMPGYLLNLPGRSLDGNQWFTTTQAAAWSRKCYNTVKNHLKEMEDDGLITPTVAQDNRHQGKQIHFRFAQNRAPPFVYKNPFLELPEL